MFSPGELLAMSDNELAIHLNGGYGAEKRNLTIAAVRSALRYQVRHSEGVVSEIMERAHNARD